MTYELTECLARHGISLKNVMNLLQKNNVVSDNSVELEDVGTADSEAAIKWIEERFKE
jgi:hypothetical protein